MWPRTPRGPGPQDLRTPSGRPLPAECSAGLGPNGTVHGSDVMCWWRRGPLRRGEAARSRAPRNPIPREADGPSRLVMPWPRRSLPYRGDPVPDDPVLAPCDEDIPAAATDGDSPGPDKVPATSTRLSLPPAAWAAPGRWMRRSRWTWRVRTPWARCGSTAWSAARIEVALRKDGAGWEGLLFSARPRGRESRGEAPPSDTCVVRERVADRAARGDAHGHFPPGGCLQRAGRRCRLAGAEGPRSDPSGLWWRGLSAFTLEADTMKGTGVMTSATTMTTALRTEHRDRLMRLAREVSFDAGSRLLRRVGAPIASGSCGPAPSPSTCTCPAAVPLSSSRSVTASWSAGPGISRRTSGSWAPRR